MGLSLALLNAVGIRPDIIELWMIVLMKGRKSCEVAWSTVEGIRSYEQVVD